MRGKTGFRKGAGFFTLMTALFLALFPFRRAEAAGRLQDTGDKLVIVIDPGHGGDNLGTTENGHEEKSMTMVTALAMYEELSLYDGVEVYLTRTSDVDLSRKERVEFAASVDADFLFSIHYNASENHELYGAEVWTSAFAPCNGIGYQFGCELLGAFREKGLFIRGVKTRLGDSGKDYYGILLYSSEKKMPAVIIEHCHVDEARDEGFCDSEEELKEFGRMDATAAARYFGLKSSVLGVDYSDHELVESSISAPVPVTVQDSTAPDVCQIELLETDYDTGRLALSVTAADYDSTLLYYSFSLDGGKTFSPREAWPGSDALTGAYSDTFTLNLTVPALTCPTVILRAYNGYDLYTESNSWTSPETYRDPEELLAASGKAEMGDGTENGQDAVSSEGKDDASKRTEDFAGGRGDGAEEQERPVSFLTFLAICLIAALTLLVIFLVSQAIAAGSRKRAARQRRKESGRSRNQPR